MHLDLLCLHVVTLLRQGHLEAEVQVQVQVQVQVEAEAEVKVEVEVQAWVQGAGVGAGAASSRVTGSLRRWRRPLAPSPTPARHGAHLYLAQVEEVLGVLGPYRRALLLLLVELPQVEDVPLGWGSRARLAGWGAVRAPGPGSGEGLARAPALTWRMASRSSPARCSYSFILLSHIELNCAEGAGGGRRRRRASVRAVGTD